MRKTFVLLGIFIVVTLVPLIPFLLWNESMEKGIAARLLAWGNDPGAVMGLTVGALSVDLFLPVPSSVVSVFAARRLSELYVPAWQGTALAIFAVWLGMTIAALSGWLVGRIGGEAVVRKMAGEEEFQRLNEKARQYGAAILVLFRAVPLCAESAALLLGCLRIPFWRSFFWPVALSNLGIALVYGILGAQTKDLPFWIVLVASIALPAAVSVVVRSVQKNAK